MSKIPANIRWQRVANALTKLGYKMAKQKGSHSLFVNEEGNMVTAVMKNPIKRGTLEGIIDKTGIPRKEFLKLL